MGISVRLHRWLGGVFSVLLTMYGHSVIERGVLRMNTNLLEFIVLALTVYISVDMSASVREALNLKENFAQPGAKQAQNFAIFRSTLRYFPLFMAAVLKKNRKQD